MQTIPLTIIVVAAATSADLRGAAGISLETFVILNFTEAAIAQLGERQTEDLKVPGSIPGLGMLSCRVGQPVDDCTSLTLFWMLQGTGLGCGAVARGRREGKPGLTHCAHLPPGGS